MPPRITNEFEKESTISIHDFEVGVTLGTGSFGRVRFARHNQTGKCFAIKMLKKCAIIQYQQVEHLHSEKTILEMLSMDKHPFIVNLAVTFQDKLFLYMALEYVVGGEFFTHLRKRGYFESPDARFYAAHIVLVFQNLHDKEIVYRDLKPENLLIDKMGYLKLTDFGFAKKVHFKTYTLCGTPEYIAPEVLLNKGHGKGVDWWTLGVLIYEMLVGQPPFVDDDPMGIYQQILSGKIAFPKGFDKHAKSLIKKLLAADLTKRYGCLKSGAEDVKKSKWFSSMNFGALLKREIEPPLTPVISGDNDTSNFDNYPDSEEEPEIPNFADGEDPFVEFT